MGRKDTIAAKSIRKMYEQLNLNQSDIFSKTKLLLGVYRDVVWITLSESARVNEELAYYHNTQLLLQHYRNIAWLLECLPVDVAAELDEPFEGVDKLIDQMDLEIALGNRKLENRMEGIVKSRLLFDRVNEALTVLSHKPGDGQKLYDVIYRRTSYRNRLRV